MANLGNPAERYSRGAILLHWIIAGLLAVNLAIGFGMGNDASSFALVQFHKSLGISILLLTLVRIAWRITHKPPPAADKGPLGAVAKAVHVLLYAFMLGAPLTGWALVSTSPLNVPTMLFGVVPWPHLPLDPAINGGVEVTHELLAFLGIGLFALHVAGALKHHFINRDGVLARMAPGGSAKAALVLFAAVLVAGGATFAMMPGGGDHSHEDAEGAAVPVAEATELAEAEALEEEAEAEVAEEEPAPEATEAAAAPPPDWDIQPGGSLRFVASNAGSALNGTFRRWDGAITMDPDNPAGSRIVIEIDLTSATLGDATQDGMLAGAEFFAVSSFPTAVFRSTDVQKTGGNSYRARGTLSIKGVTRPQTISFTLGGSGNARSVTGSATVDRNAFGVGTGEAAGGIAADVRVEFAFDATR
ncbi:cytochrome b/b6 domain-containing protein [Altererythrobacter lauratis]|uniref:Cytochrome b/b6 domain-containing protein n=1 Tax=Alteraurantiacibacter lauratis TaxID=2054627 RepID=A0ABV7EI59_9SPHN